MWLAGEIKQGDSGQTVSNKLDAEFIRLQANEVDVADKLAGLEYADEITVFDRTKTSLIVSPYTFWVALDPTTVKVEQSKTITDHFSNQLFDGISWMRSDVSLEYSGTFIPLEDLGEGFFLTKAHYREFYEDLEAEFVKQDGTTTMAVGYEPTLELDVVTKTYNDTLFIEMLTRAKTSYIEFDPSSDGDTAFGASLTGVNFLVFLNGVMQRRNKYSYSESGIVFNKALSANDEVTIVILGE